MDVRDMKTGTQQQGKKTCGACQTAMNPGEVARALSADLCETCFATLSAAACREECRRFFRQSMRQCC